MHRPFYPAYAATSRIPAQHLLVNGCWKTALVTFVIHSFIHSSFSSRSSKYHKFKPLELESWYFCTIFTTSHMSCAMCHVTSVTCHLSGVRSFKFLLHKLSDLVVEDLLSTGMTPSSLWFICDNKAFISVFNSVNSLHLRYFLMLQLFPSVSVFFSYLACWSWPEPPSFCLLEQSYRTIPCALHHYLMLDPKGIKHHNICFLINKTTSLCLY